MPATRQPTPTEVTAACRRSDLWTRRGGSEGKEEGRVGVRRDNRPKHHKRPSPPPRRAQRGKGGIREALGVRVAEADCHEQGSLPSLGVATSGGGSSDLAYARSLRTATRVYVVAVTLRTQGHSERNISCHYKTQETQALSGHADHTDRPSGQSLSEHADLRCRVHAQTDRKTSRPGTRAEFLVSAVRRACALRLLPGLLSREQFRGRAPGRPRPTSSPAVRALTLNAFSEPAAHATPAQPRPRTRTPARRAPTPAIGWGRCRECHPCARAADDTDGYDIRYPTAILIVSTVRRLEPWLSPPGRRACVSKQPVVCATTHEGVVWRSVSVRCYLWPTSTLCCSTGISRPVRLMTHTRRALRVHTEDGKKTCQSHVTCLVGVSTCPVR
eukprot:scaffold8422_cov82-Phaeocystis_antarctica.AAC.8